MNNSPSLDQTSKLAEMLYKKAQHAKNEKISASTKNVLALLGAGATIIAAFIAPNAVRLFKEIKPSDEWPDWKKFNEPYLRQTLKRLAKRKLVEIKEVNGEQRIIISEAGKTKIFQLAIDELTIQPQKKWDKRWRLIIYDIPNRKKRLQKLMRETLKNLGFLAMQESVYITPFPCYKEIEFLRQYYQLDSYLKYLLVEKIEDDSAYKAYFGLP